MSPPPTFSSPADTLSDPLADYFFIAGIESSCIFDSGEGTNSFPNSPLLGETIDEDDHIGREPTNPDSARGTPDGAQRRARFSYEARKSLQSVLDYNTSPIKRSSAITVRPAQDRSEGLGAGQGLGDVTFDQALRKFAAERDSFLEEIQFSAGQLPQPSRPRPPAKTQRMSKGDQKRETSRGGSLRRRLSSINPLSRQSTSSRRNSNRLSKRLSGYNSVIAAPQTFQAQKNMHPLKRNYEPILLDQYPPKDDKNTSRRRSPFPSYVPMFAFPNDVNVVAADERPRSTWHGFTMTNGDGSKLYGMCLIIWMPLQVDAANELEHQCEQWREGNMSTEEREVANYLGERLAIERARLSELLAVLPSLASGTDEREAHEEEISKVEERIAVTSDILRPVRHGAASKIDGLTDGDTGFWIPRAYGVLGRDPNLMSFWKEWLRVVATPMAGGCILRVPPSSPRVGIWQPLERYVVNLCTEAPSPMSSITQVELAVRELRLYARKDALNEIPGSRSTDLYPLFRCLDVQDVIVLLEYMLMESRIILLSSHTSMLYSACAAITQLLYPLKWAGIFIPVLPARLIQALEAPCPYLVGIERRYESVELPSDDFVLVDLDQGVIEATAPPTSLPRQQRRKLVSILQLAAPHRNRFGVTLGPPKYVTDAYPFDAFPSENPSVFDHSMAPTTLANLANTNSASFGASAAATVPKIPPLFNTFLQPMRSSKSFSGDRPPTTSTQRTSSPLSPLENNPPGCFGLQNQAVSRHDSGYKIQHTLREKRSGIFDRGSLRRNSSVFVVPLVTNRLSNVTDKAKIGLGSIGRRPSIPMSVHSSAASITTIGTDNFSSSTYAPSIYAQSTLAASTVMPNVIMQPVKNTETTMWSEGHCLQWQANNDRAICSVCNEKVEEGLYRCSGCGMTAHHRCSQEICLVCPVAFFPDQIVAAFVRCFASLFYTYRKFLTPATVEQKKSGQLYRFNMDGFIGSVPREHSEYLTALRDTQAFNEFIHDREQTPPSDPSIHLFDVLITSKRARARARPLFQTSKLSQSTNFLADTSDHIWRTAAAPSPVSRGGGWERGSGGVGKTPAKLDPARMREPRVVQGAPLGGRERVVRRKKVPGLLGVEMGRGGEGVGVQLRGA